MSKLIYTFALVVALITFVICTVNDISLFTGFVRSALVFLGILFLFSIAGHLLRMVVILGKSDKREEEEKVSQKV